MYHYHCHAHFLLVNSEKRFKSQGVSQALFALFTLDCLILCLNMKMFIMLMPCFNSLLVCPSLLLIYLRFVHNHQLLYANFLALLHLKYIPILFLWATVP